MTRLMLIRHGVTRWNKEKRYCGHKDIGLSREGRSQIKLLFNRLNAIKFDKIYCSNRKRAIQTARILFKREKMIRHQGLREINFGVLEGLRYEEIMQKYAHVYEKWLKDSFKNNIPGAEPMNVFKRRVAGTIKRIACSNHDKTIAVVCHGGVIGVFVNGILKNRNFWRCVPLPASITIVEYRRGRPGLKVFNDTEHLKVSDE